MSSIPATHVIQVTNVAPAASIDQMKVLFGYMGRINDIKLYPSDSCIIETQSKVCYVEYHEKWSVGVAQHLTNTVFIDRALIVVPIADEGIPSESTALSLTNPSSALPGLASAGANGLINEISGVDGSLVITTTDPKLTALGLPQYPPLPANLDPAKIEEIRRTVVVGNLDSTTSAENLLKFINQIGEVKYLRMGGDGITTAKYALVEFTDQASIPKVLQYNGVAYENRPMIIQHSTTAIIKPMPKSSETAQKEIEEAMKRVREAQSLITAAIEPELPEKDRKRSRKSRSRSRSHHRSTSRSRGKRRSRSRSKRSRSHSKRSRSHSKRSRSHSKQSRSRKRSREHRQSRTPSRQSKHKSRSRSRDRKKVSPHYKKGRSRSRSRDRSKRSHKSKSRSPSKSSSKSRPKKSKRSEDKHESKEREKTPRKHKSDEKESSESAKSRSYSHKESSPHSYADQKSSPYSYTHKEDSPHNYTHKEDSSHNYAHKESSPHSSTHKENSPHSYTHKENSPHSCTQKESSPQSDTHKEGSPHSYTHKADSPHSYTNKEDSVQSYTHKESSSHSYTESSLHSYAHKGSPSSYTHIESPPSHNSKENSQCCELYGPSLPITADNSSFHEGTKFHERKSDSDMSLSPASLNTESIETNLNVSSDINLKENLHVEYKVGTLCDERDQSAVKFTELNYEKLSIGDNMNDSQSIGTLDNSSTALSKTPVSAPKDYCSIDGNDVFVTENRTHCDDSSSVMFEEASTIYETAIHETIDAAISESKSTEHEDFNVTEYDSNQELKGTSMNNVTCSISPSVAVNNRIESVTDIPQSISVISTFGLGTNDVDKNSPKLPAAYIPREKMNPIKSTKHDKHKSSRSRSRSPISVKRKEYKRTRSRSLSKESSSSHKNKSRSPSKHRSRSRSRKKSRSRSKGSRRKTRSSSRHHHTRQRSRSTTPLSKRDSYSPGRHSISRQRRSSKRHSTSSRKRSVTPKRKSRTPRRRSRTPMKRSRTPVKRSRTPVKRSRTPVKRSRTPVKRSRSPKRRSRSRSYRSRSPQRSRKQRSPIRRTYRASKSPRSDSSSPSPVKPRSGHRRDSRENDSRRSPSFDVDRANKDSKILQEQGEKEVCNLENVQQKDKEHISYVSEKTDNYNSGDMDLGSD